MALDYDLENTHIYEVGTFPLGSGANTLQAEKYSEIKLDKVPPNFEASKLAQCARIELEHTATFNTRAGDGALDPIYFHLFVDSKMSMPGGWEFHEVLGEHYVQRQLERFGTALESRRGGIDPIPVPAATEETGATATRTWHQFMDFQAPDTDVPWGESWPTCALALGKLMVRWRNLGSSGSPTILAVQDRNSNGVISTRTVGVYVTNPQTLVKIHMSDQKVLVIPIDVLYGIVSTFRDKEATPGGFPFLTLSLIRSIFETVSPEDLGLIEQITSFGLEGKEWARNADIVQWMRDFARTNITDPPISDQFRSATQQGAFRRDDPFTNFDGRTPMVPLIAPFTPQRLPLTTKDKRVYSKLNGPKLNLNNNSIVYDNLDFMYRALRARQTAHKNLILSAIRDLAVVTKGPYKHPLYDDSVAAAKGLAPYPEQMVPLLVEYSMKG